MLLSCCTVQGSEATVKEQHWGEEDLSKSHSSSTIIDDDSQAQRQQDRRLGFWIGRYNGGGTRRRNRNYVFRNNYGNGKGSGKGYSSSNSKGSSRSKGSGSNGKGNFYSRSAGNGERAVVTRGIAHRARGIAYRRDQHHHHQHSHDDQSFSNHNADNHHHHDHNHAAVETFYGRGSVTRPARISTSLVRGPFPDGFRPNRIRSTRPPSPTLSPTIAPTTPGGTAAPTVPAAGATAAPTVAGATAAPTVPVATTAAPTVPVGTTAAPTTPVNPFEGAFRTQLDLTYFMEPTDTDRDLTAEEYTELASLLEEFYTAYFQDDPVFATDFISIAPITIDTANAVYTAGATGPDPPSIRAEFFTNFMFQPGTTITTTQVLEKITATTPDWMRFITEYLQRNPPMNQLDQTQQFGVQACLIEVGTTCEFVPLV